MVIVDKNVKIAVMDLAQVVQEVVLVVLVLVLVLVALDVQQIVVIIVMKVVQKLVKTNAKTQEILMQLDISKHKLYKERLIKVFPYFFLPNFLLIDLI